MILQFGHSLLETQTLHAIHSAPHHNFPKLHVRHCIPEEGIQSVNTKRLDRVSEVSGIKTTIMHVDENDAVGTIEHDDHSPFLYVEQRINSPVKYAARLAVLLSILSESLSPRDVVSSYKNTQ